MPKDPARADLDNQRQSCVCAAGDVDGNGVSDVTLVRVVSRELDVVSGEDSSLLRHLALDALPSAR